MRKVSGMCESGCNGVVAVFVIVYRGPLNTKVVRIS